MAYQTIDDVIDALVSDLSMKEYSFGPDFDRKDRFGEYVVPQYLGTHRDKLAQWMRNTIEYRNTEWHGPLVGESLLILLQTSSLDRAVANYQQKDPSADMQAIFNRLIVLPLMRRIYPQLLIHEIGFFQPHTAVCSELHYLDVYQISDGDNPGKVITMPSTSIGVTRDTWLCAGLMEDSSDWNCLFQSRGVKLDDLVEGVGSLSREIALELNHRLIYGFRDKSCVKCEISTSNLPNGIDSITSHIRGMNLGDPTHIVASPAAFDDLMTLYSNDANVRSSKLDWNLAGFIETATLTSTPNVLVVKCPFIHGKVGNAILLLHRPEHWSTVPVVCGYGALTVAQSKWSPTPEDRYIIETKTKCVPERFGIVDIN